MHNAGVGLCFLGSEGVPGDTGTTCRSHHSSLIPRLCPLAGQASDAAERNTILLIQSNHKHVAQSASCFPEALLTLNLSVLGEGAAGFRGF